MTRTGTSKLSIAALLLAACASAQEADTLRATAQRLFGSIPPVQAEEIRAPIVELGRALFWDERLSSSGSIACASCHPATAAGADDRRFSIDARGRPTARNAQTVFNSQAASAGLRWTADRPSGAAQAVGSITGSLGFDSAADIVPVLDRSGYRDLFAKAFPDDVEPISAESFGLALEAYQRTLRTPARFDRWLDGDDAALTEVELRGLERFITIGCAGCHDGPLLGGTRLERFGITEDYRPHTGSTGTDTGRMRATGNESDRDVFRVQPLRNVSMTAPYFHDGSVPDLRTAARIMARVQLGRTLTDAELDELVAFLRALAGEVPAHYAPPVDSQASPPPPAN